MENQDILGALTRIAPEQILSALILVKQGKTYDLGLEINERIPQGDPGTFTPFSYLTRVSPEAMGKQGPFQFSAETIIGCLHVSTHIDAFIHVQYEDRVFGGAQAADLRTDRGWKQYGMETVTIRTGAAGSECPYWRILSMEIPDEPRIVAILASAPGLSRSAMRR